MNNKFKKIGFLLLSSSILLAACNNNIEEKKIKTNETKNNAEITLEQINYSKIQLKNDFNDEDLINIDFKNSNISSSKNSNYNFKNDILEITKSGIYKISGDLAGQIIINTSDKNEVILVLDNLNLKSNSGPAILVENAKETIINLNKDSKNYISDSKNYSNDEDFKPNAVIYSSDDLTFNGTGLMSITSNYEKAINTRDTLRITNGTFEINSIEDGIIGKDNVSILNGNFNLDVNGDAIVSSNSENNSKGNILIDSGDFKIISDQDSFQSKNSILISDGNFNILSGDGYTSKINNSNPENMKNFNPEDMRGFNPNDVKDFNPQDDKNRNINENMKPNNDKRETSMKNSSFYTEDDISSKGFKSVNKLIINNGKFEINSFDDAIHSNGSIEINNGIFNIYTSDDGIHADQNLIINNIDLLINNSYEGLEAKNIIINDGKYVINSDDDGINANVNNESILSINGGNIIINASGDGVDSNKDIFMKGGSIIVNGPTSNGNGALDYDGEFILEKGNLIASGSSGMLQTISDKSKQSSIVMLFDNVIENNNSISLLDANDNIVLEFKTVKNIESVVFSSDKIIPKENYSLLVNNEKILSFQALNGNTWLNNDGYTEEKRGFGSPGGFDRPDRKPRGE